MCSMAGPDAEENGTDGTARCGATWRPSKASAAGLGAQGKGDKAAHFTVGIAVLTTHIFERVGVEVLW